MATTQHFDGSPAQGKVSDREVARRLRAKVYSSPIAIERWPVSFAGHLSKITRRTWMMETA